MIIRIYMTFRAMRLERMKFWAKGRLMTEGLLPTDQFGWHRLFAP